MKLQITAVALSVLLAACASTEIDNANDAAAIENGFSVELEPGEESAPWAVTDAVDNWSVQWSKTFVTEYVHPQISYEPHSEVTWLAPTALGFYGSMASTMHHIQGNTMLFSAWDAGPTPTALLNINSRPNNLGNLAVAAKTTDLVATLHYEIHPLELFWRTCNIYLRLYNANGLLWERSLYDDPNGVHQLQNQPFCSAVFPKLYMSEDGSVIVTQTAAGTNRPTVHVFHSNSSQPFSTLYDAPATTAENFPISLSGDGNIFITEPLNFPNDGSHVNVYDLSTPGTPTLRDVIQTNPLTAVFGTTAPSFDGSLIAVSHLQLDSSHTVKTKLYKYNAVTGHYEVALTTPNWPGQLPNPSIVISRDQSRLALAYNPTNIQSPIVAHVELWDLNASLAQGQIVKTMSLDHSTYSGSLVLDLKISQDGKRLAMSSGSTDLATMQAHAMINIFAEGQGTSVFEHRRTFAIPGNNFFGTPWNRFDFSADGKHLLVASQDTYQPALGNPAPPVYYPTTFDYLDLADGDLKISDTPRAGQTREFTMRTGPNRPVRLLKATALAATPLVLPYGTLYVNPAQSQVVATTTSDANGIAHFTYTFPMSSAGNKLFFQGLAMGQRDLTEDMIAAIVAPQ